MKKHVINIFLCCQFGLLAVLLSGCVTTTNIPVTIREPEKWNKQRAFEVINASGNHINKEVFDTLSRSDNPELYRRTKSEPFINNDGLLLLSTKTTHVEHGPYVTRVSGVLEKKRVFPDIQHVGLQRKRSHWWTGYWSPLVILFAPPASDTFDLYVSGQGETRLVSWSRSPLMHDGAQWWFFPFWLAHPFHYLNNPEVREVAEAFEWLRLNGKSFWGAESFREQNLRDLEADLIRKTRAQPNAAPLSNSQITITLQSDGNADIGAVLKSGSALAKILSDAGQNAKPVPAALLDAAAKTGMTEKAALDTIQKAVFITGASIAFASPSEFGGATVKSVSRERFILTLNKPGGKEAALTHTVDFADVTVLKLRTNQTGKENGIVLLKGPAPIFVFDSNDDKTRDEYLAALVRLCATY